MLIHTIENNEMIQIKFFQFVFLKNQKFEMLRDHRVPIEARAGIVCILKIVRMNICKDRYIVELSISHTYTEVVRVAHFSCALVGTYCRLFFKISISVFFC